MAYDALTSKACLASAAAYAAAAPHGVRILSDILTGAQARVWCEDNVTIVAFRGSSSANDWVHNFLGVQKSLPAPHRRDVRAHAGFLHQYCSLHVRLMLLLEELGASHVLFCGHSLAGALATIATTMLPSTYTCDLVTFGSPRAGNARMAEVAGLRAVHNVRVVHDRDIVPTVPMRLMGYSHVPGPWILLRPDATIQHTGAERTLMQELCIRARGVLSIDFGISDHFIGSYVTAVSLGPGQAETNTEQDTTADKTETEQDTAAAGTEQGETETGL